MSASFDPSDGQMIAAAASGMPARSQVRRARGVATHEVDVGPGGAALALVQHDDPRVELVALSSSMSSRAVAFHPQTTMWSE